MISKSFSALVALSLLCLLPVGAAPAFSLGPTEADWTVTGIVLAAGEEIVGFPLIGSTRAVQIKNGKDYFLITEKERFGPFFNSALVLPEGYTGNRVAFAALQPASRGLNGWYVFVGGKRKGPYVHVGAIAADPEGRFAYAGERAAGKDESIFTLEVEGEKKPRFEFSVKNSSTLYCYLAWDKAANNFACAIEPNNNANPMVYHGGVLEECTFISKGFLVSPKDGRLVYIYRPVADKLARVRDGGRSYGPYSSVYGLTLNRSDTVSYLAATPETGADGKQANILAAYTGSQRLAGPSVDMKNVEKLLFAVFSEDGATASWGFQFPKGDTSEKHALELLEKMNSGESIDSAELFAGASFGFLGDRILGPYSSLNVQRLIDAERHAYAYTKGWGHYYVRDGVTYGPFPGTVSSYENDSIAVGSFDLRNFEERRDRDAEALLDRIDRTAGTPLYQYRNSGDAKAQSVLMRGKEEVGTFDAVFSADLALDGKGLVYAAKEKGSAEWTIFANGTKRTERGSIEAYAHVPRKDEPVYVIYDGEYNVFFEGKKFGPFKRFTKDYDSHNEGFDFAHSGSIIAFKASMVNSDVSAWVIAKGTLYPGVVDPVLDEVRFFADGKVMSIKGIQ